MAKMTNIGPIHIDIPEDATGAPYSRFYIDWMERVLYGKGADEKWHFISPLPDNIEMTEVE